MLKLRLPVALVSAFVAISHASFAWGAPPNIPLATGSGVAVMPTPHGPFFDITSFGAVSGGAALANQAAINNAIDASPNGATVAISGLGVAPTGPVTFVDSTTLKVDLSVQPSAVTGARNITVTNPDNQARTCVGCFTVTPPPRATASGFSPAQRAPGLSNQVITISGSGFTTSWRSWTRTTASPCSWPGTGSSKHNPSPS